MELYTFVMEKTLELKDKYSFAELDSLESVVLSKNSVSQEFNSKKTPLTRKGSEVSLSTLEDLHSIGFTPNGTLVRFAVKLPRKRKTIKVDFYFLWESEGY